MIQQAQIRTQHILCEAIADQAFCRQTNSPKGVLLLQGPVGPFFTRLHRRLLQEGRDVLRVCFHPADRPWDPRHKRLHFNSTLDDWRRFLHQTLGSGRFGIVILFGADRPVHQIARQVSRSYPVQVLCLEEGYIRPGYITVETLGNNAGSPIAGRLPRYVSQPADVPLPCPASDGFAWMCLYGGWHYLIRQIASSPGQRRLFHRPAPVLRESFCWIRNLTRKITRHRRNRADLGQLVRHCHRQFYLVALQVDADANLIHHGNEWTTARLIACVTASFARNAPPQHRLVFKVHPMARGHDDPTASIMAKAAEHGIADRVDIITAGSMGSLLRHAAGLVTINSTSGLSAIFHGVPLLALGRAIYAHPALCQTDGDIDRFWQGGKVAHAALRAQYLAWLKTESLRPGDFYSPAGQQAAVQSVMGKLDPAARAAPSDIRIAS